MLIDFTSFYRVINYVLIFQSRKSWRKDNDGNFTCVIDASIIRGVGVRFWRAGVKFWGCGGDMKVCIEVKNDFSVFFITRCTHLFNTLPHLRVSSGGISDVLWSFLQQIVFHFSARKISLTRVSRRRILVSFVKEKTLISDEILVCNECIRGFYNGLQTIARVWWRISSSLFQLRKEQWEVVLGHKS